MSTSAIPRHAAGTRQGGQFAAYRQEDQPGSLEPGTDDWYDADAETALAAVFDPDFMDDLQDAVNIASTLYPRYAGDLLGETYEAVHARVTRAHEGRLPLKLGDTNRRSYLATIAKSRGLALATGLDSGADVAGWTEFNRRRASLESRMGRTLSGTERDALADEVRDKFPPRRRPGPKYYQAVADSSALSVSDFDCRDGDGSRPLVQHDKADAAAAEEASGWSDGLRASPVMQEMVRVHQAGASVKRGTAERMVYTLAAVEHGAPLPAEGGVTEKVWYSQHKKALERAGGVEEAIQAYESGNCDPAAEAALFAPVTPPGGTLSDREKQAVCRALGHFPGGAAKTHAALVGTVLQHEADAQREVAGRA